METPIHGLETFSALQRYSIYNLTNVIYLVWQRDICMNFLLNPKFSAFISCKPIFKRFCIFKDDAYYFSSSLNLKLSNAWTYRNIRTKI